MLESFVSVLPCDWFSLSGWPRFLQSQCKGQHTAFLKKNNFKKHSFIYITMMNNNRTLLNTTIFLLLNLTLNTYPRELKSLKAGLHSVFLTSSSLTFFASVESASTVLVTLQ